MPRQIFSSDHIRDALLNPDVVTIRERQQEILKGLSKLRQVSKNLLDNCACIYICVYIYIDTEVKNHKKLSHHYL